MEAELIERMGDIADAALSRHHRLAYHERINALLDALHVISEERIEYANNKEVASHGNCALQRVR